MKLCAFKASQSQHYIVRSCLKEQNKTKNNKDSRYPGTRFTGGSQLPDVGAGNLTQVLCKRTAELSNLPRPTDAVPSSFVSV